MATYDLLNMGRSGIDLYSNDVGSPFVDIQSFAAYVGGSPTNICVGARRLGLKTALLTAVGVDPVGDFILNFLNHEGIETGYIPRKPGHNSSAVVLGIEPPSHFPIMFYRDNCADNQLTIDDVLAAPLNDCKVFQFAGTNLAKEPVRSATLFAAEQAKAAGAKVVLDIDFRPGQWHDVRAFGVAVRSALRLVDVVIGTEDEINAAVVKATGQVNITQSQTDTHVAGDSRAGIEQMMALGPQLFVEKRGADGARLHEPGKAPVDVPGFPVEIANILGAGDAFGGGFLYGYVNGWSHYRSARLGNACGAIVVTEHGCANFMPTMERIESFVKPYGGLD
ncbi:MAG TPA: 5-dehydro-2-deoxygluconokinase [Aggregatilineales bacterium]|nr:5-dehydro-2-deoxygluconokinase [Aggregatilineales bacterium]